MDRLLRTQRILDTIRDIPEGCVASYGQIADITGLVRGARQVGHALTTLPDGHDVPWHRVITASGRIAFEKGSPRFVEQRERLVMEGIAVNSDCVDMSIFRWQPDLDELLWKPSSAWDES